MNNLKIIDASRSLTSHLYENEEFNSHISLDDLVLIVGPGTILLEEGEKILMDPTLLTLATYLSQGSGHIDVLDLSPEEKDIGGWKNWELLKKYMDSWQQKGAKFCSYNFIEGNILDPQLSIGPYNVLIDHCSWIWILPPPIDVKKLKELAQIYHNLLTNDGKAIIHFEEIYGRSGHVELMIDAFLTQRFNITKYVRINDEYKVKDPIVLMDLKSSFSKKYMKGESILVPYNRSFEFIVAKK